MRRYRDSARRDTYRFGTATRRKMPAMAAERFQGEGEKSVSDGYTAAIVSVLEYNLFLSTSLKEAAERQGRSQRVADEAARIAWIERRIAELDAQLGPEIPRERLVPGAALYDLAAYRRQRRQRP